jgi:hypothetical protein
LNFLAINVTFGHGKCVKKIKEKRPTFQVRNCSGGGAVWLLLSRHITDIEDFRQYSLAQFLVPKLQVILNTKHIRSVK